MAAYIAMLRGVNVTGHNTIKMEVLRGLCQGLGFRNVETYVQSGNIVFQALLENPEAISKRIGETVLRSFGFDTPVIVRTSKEMRNVIGNNPFLKEKGIDSSKLHVTFLSETAQKGSEKNWKHSQRIQTDFTRRLMKSTCTVPVGMAEPDSPTMQLKKRCR